MKKAIQQKSEVTILGIALDVKLTFWKQLLIYKKQGNPFLELLYVLIRCKNSISLENNKSYHKPAITCGAIEPQQTKITAENKPIN